MVGPSGGAPFAGEIWGAFLHSQGVERKVEFGVGIVYTFRGEEYLKDQLQGSRWYAAFVSGYCRNPCKYGRKVQALQESKSIADLVGDGCPDVLGAGAGAEAMGLVEGLNARFAEEDQECLRIYNDGLRARLNAAPIQRDRSL